MLTERRPTTYNIAGYIFFWNEYGPKKPNLDNNETYYVSHISEILFLGTLSRIEIKLGRIGHPRSP